MRFASLDAAYQEGTGSIMPASGARILPHPLLPGRQLDGQREGEVVVLGDTALQQDGHHGIGSGNTRACFL